MAQEDLHTSLFVTGLALIWSSASKIDRLAGPYMQSTLNFIVACFRSIAKGLRTLN